MRVIEGLMLSGWVPEPNGHPFLWPRKNAGENLQMTLWAIQTLRNQKGEGVCENITKMGVSENGGFDGTLRNKAIIVTVHGFCFKKC